MRLSIEFNTEENHKDVFLIGLLASSLGIGCKGLLQAELLERGESNECNEEDPKAEPEEKPKRTRSSKKSNVKTKATTEETVEDKEETTETVEETTTDDEQPKDVSAVPEDVAEPKEEEVCVPTPKAPLLKATPVEFRERFANKRAELLLEKGQDREEYGAEFNRFLKNMCSTYKEGCTKPSTLDEESLYRFCEEMDKVEFDEEKGTFFVSNLPF